MHMHPHQNACSVNGNTHTFPSSYVGTCFPYSKATCMSQVTFYNVTTITQQVAIITGRREDKSCKQDHVHISEVEVPTYTMCVRILQQQMVTFYRHSLTGKLEKLANVSLMSESWFHIFFGFIPLTMFAPRARALKMCPPWEKPPSTYTSQRPATASTTSGRASIFGGGKKKGIGIT